MTRSISQRRSCIPEATPESRLKCQDRCGGEGAPVKSVKVCVRRDMCGWVGVILCCLIKGVGFRTGVQAFGDWTGVGERCGIEK